MSTEKTYYEIFVTEEQITKQARAIRELDEHDPDVASLTAYRNAVKDFLQIIMEETLDDAPYHIEKRSGLFNRLLRKHDKS